MRTTLAALTLTALALAGCGSDDPSGNGTAGSASSAASSAASPASSDAASSAASSADLLARNGLSGKDARAIIADLEASQEDREAGPMGSVRPDQLILSDDGGEVSLPIPDGQFYLSIAPYLTQTHDCFNHNLATCQGELAGEEVALKVTGSDGKVVFDETVTTAANGFAGIWLPRDIEATLTVTHDGKTATTPIATGADDPTCLTTVKLA
ncbi:MAG: CueP family metal-binding protein [Micrococcales bacterium]|nr:CueP family metal-binding protein [Micrococcales bacterium]